MSGDRYRHGLFAYRQRAIDSLGHYIVAGAVLRLVERHAREGDIICSSIGTGAARAHAFEGQAFNAAREARHGLFGTGVGLGIAVRCQLHSRRIDRHRRTARCCCVAVQLSLEFNRVLASITVYRAALQRVVAFRILIPDRRACYARFRSYTIFSSVIDYFNIFRVYRQTSLVLVDREVRRIDREGVVRVGFFQFSLRRGDAQHVIVQAQRIVTCVAPDNRQVDVTQLAGYVVRHRGICERRIIFAVGLAGIRSRDGHFAFADRNRRAARRCCVVGLFNLDVNSLCSCNIRPGRSFFAPIFHLKLSAVRIDLAVVNLSVALGRRHSNRVSRLVIGSAIVHSFNRHSCVSDRQRAVGCCDVVVSRLGIVVQLIGEFVLAVTNIRLAAGHIVCRAFAFNEAVEAFGRFGDRVVRQRSAVVDLLVACARQLHGTGRHGQRAFIRRIVVVRVHCLHRIGDAASVLDARRSLAPGRFVSAVAQRRSGRYARGRSAVMRIAIVLVTVVHGRYGHGRLVDGQRTGLECYIIVGRNFIFFCTCLVFLRTISNIGDGRRSSDRILNRRHIAR